VAISAALAAPIVNVTEKRCSVAVAYQQLTWTTAGSWREGGESYELRRPCTLKGGNSLRSKPMKQAPDQA